MKNNILNYTPPELEQILKGYNEKNYRAKQIYISLHNKLVQKIEDIKGIPSELKEKFNSDFFIDDLKLLLVRDSQKSNTRKFLFKLSDTGSAKSKEKLKIETVLISEKGRHTICISTQVGCNVGCEYCATSRMGFKKNLDVSDIVNQVYNVIRITGIKPTNLVFMGMGEPFLNYENVLKSFKILTSEIGLNISSKRITLSTIGLKGKIKKFTDDITKEENWNLKNIKLALSLHSTDNGIRESLIPVSNKNKLSDIYNEIIYYYQKTRSKVTYEYIFFKDLNNTEHDIKRLEKLSKMIPCNINVIPFHPIGFELKKPLDKFNKDSKHSMLNSNDISLYNEGINHFIAKLKSRKIVVNLRSSSGVDINAACGQLAVIERT